MAMNGRGPLEFHKDQREAVAEMLRYGMSSREIERVTGIPYRTICRFGHYLGIPRYKGSGDRRVTDPAAVIVRDVAPNTTDEEAAGKDLEASFRHYEVYGGRVAYERWQNALRHFNGVREESRHAQPSSPL